MRDLRYLKGMPLKALFIENTRIETLRGLDEVKLEELRLNNSPVQSLKGVEGQPLENRYSPHMNYRGFSHSLIKFKTTLVFGFACFRC